MPTRWRRHLFGLALGLALTLSGRDAFAEPARPFVSIKNGNLYLAFTDVSFVGSRVRIERGYNSKSGYVGMFGFGWGSDFEGYLVPLADGTVVVHENGGGAVNLFVPIVEDRGRIDRLIDALVELERQDGVAPPELTAYADRLARDQRYRGDQTERRASLLTLPTGAAAGTRLYSPKFGDQSIVVTSAGYQRRYADGRSQLYDAAGRLVREIAADGHAIAIARDERGRIARLADDDGRAIDLEYTERGFVRALRTHDGRTASYEYRDVELVASRDIEGRGFTYQWDSGGRHNLMGVAYDDATFVAMTYLPMELNEGVRSVRDREGQLFRYEYSGDALRGDRFGTSVAVFDPDGAPMGREVFTYEDRVGSFGRRYTHRLTIERDGDTTSTTYDEAGRPLVVEGSGGRHAFGYDALGRVVRAEDGIRQLALEYDGAGRLAVLRGARVWRRVYDALGRRTRDEVEGVGARITTYDAEGVAFGETWQGDPDLPRILDELWAEAHALLRAGSLDHVLTRE